MAETNEISQSYTDPKLELQRLVQKEGNDSCADCGRKGECPQAVLVWSLCCEARPRERVLSRQEYPIIIKFWALRASEHLACRVIELTGL